MPEDSRYHEGEFVPPGAGDFTPPTEDAVPTAVSRNDDRKWIIPVAAVGCGCICLPLLAIALSIAGIGNTVQRLYKSTGTYQVYQLASETVENDAAVAEALGHPVEAGWTSKSREAYGTDDSGKVCMRFNVSGDDRSGSAYAEARTEQGAWRLHQLFVVVNGDIELIPVVPLSAEQSPLCPNFDAPDSDFEDSPAPELPELSEPERGTEI